MKTNKNIILNIFWILLGGALMILSQTEILTDSLYIGMGGGLFAVGIVQLARSIFYKTNVEYKEKVDIAVTDERNRYLRMKAWAWAGYCFVLICAVASVVFLLLAKPLYMQVASFALCLLLVLYWVAYLVLCRKY